MLKMSVSVLVVDWVFNTKRLTNNAVASTWRAVSSLFLYVGAVHSSSIEIANCTFL